ncbi:12742_t:CDS:2 [Rhizophagus irregularis]|nr:12742_t:CDS:2 [Rhizophagus irregularis]
METKAYADWNVDHSFLDNARWHCIIPAFNEASADLPDTILYPESVCYTSTNKICRMTSIP